MMRWFGVEWQAEARQAGQARQAGEDAVGRS